MSKNFSIFLIISGRSKSTTVSNQVNNQENTEEFELIKAVLINIGRIDKISNLNDAQSFEGNNSRHGVHKSAHPWTSCKNHKLPGCPRHFSPITNAHHQTRFPDYKIKLKLKSSNSVTNYRTKGMLIVSSNRNTVLVIHPSSHEAFM